MTKRKRRNHSPVFKAKVALAAVRGERWTLSAGQLIDIVKWNLLCHIPVKMRGAEDDEEETTKSFTSV